MSHNIKKPLDIFAFQRFRSSGAFAQSHQNSNCVHLVSKDAKFSHAYNEDRSD